MGISTLGRYGFAAMMMAGVHSAVAAMPEEVSGHFLDVPALLENRAETTTSPLLANIKAPHLETYSAFGGYQVSSAMLRTTQEEYGGFIVVVTRGDGGFTALVNTAARKGLVLGKADGTQTFQEEMQTDEQRDDAIVDPRLPAENLPRADVPSSPAEARQNVTLTVLAGFSTASAQRVGDPIAFAQAQIETLNMALRNTGVPHIRMALAGISITPVDYPPTAENLARVESLFPNHARADLVASFVSTWEGINGIAYLNGRTSMTHVASTSTFAHEIGHNIGGMHCPSPGGGYHYGYSNGTYGSLLCRTSPEYLLFSTPDKLGPDGAPMGNPLTADMARVWRENAPEKSSGEGNDSQKPILLMSLAALTQCLDVLGGNPTPGAQVGLWTCDRNNPNQRWNKLYDNERVQFRLAANPKLCLATESSGADTRAVVVTEVGCPYLRWTEEDRTLKILGNGAYLYLWRSDDNKLSAVTRSSSNPNTSFEWIQYSEPSP